jgi:hypothetical protein
MSRMGEPETWRRTRYPADVAPRDPESVFGSLGLWIFPKSAFRLMCRHRRDGSEPCRG